MKATLSPLHISAFKLARDLGADQAKAHRKLVWADVRRTYDLPTTLRLKAEIDDTTCSQFGVVCNKATGVPIEIVSNEWVPEEAPKRWFAYELSMGLDEFYDNNEWDDGDEEFPDDTLEMTIDDMVIRVGNGQAWVLLSRDTF